MFRNTNFGHIYSGIRILVRLCSLLTGNELHALRPNEDFILHDNNTDESIITFPKHFLKFAAILLYNIMTSSGHLYC